MIVALPAASAAPRSYILHERAAQFHGAGAGYLSIKSFRGGQARYAVGRARFAVDEHAYLVLNHGRDYEIEIESAAPVESLCVFFAPPLAATALRDSTSPHAQLLADPARPTPEPLFFERTYPHGDAISRRLGALRHALSAGQAELGWLDEQVHELLRALLMQRNELQREVEQLPAARPATRDELYRRLHLARDFAAACFEQPLTLAALADVAGMSANHLLRTFRHAFGQTPYQYLTAQRILAAQRRLAGSDEPISSICLAVGFESLGAFSWLFRRHTGMSPSEYRRQSR